MDVTKDSGYEIETTGVKEKVIVGSTEFNQAVLSAKPKPWSKRLLQLYAICSVAFLCSTLNGYDNSLLPAIQVMPAFQNYFGSGIVGARIGIISGMYQIGGVAALFFIGPALDMYGRRIGMMGGCFIVIVATIISATGGSIGTFLAGRFLLGFGAAIAGAAGPTYVVEMAHPLYRGTLTGAYNIFYFVGSLIGAGVPLGTSYLTTNASWQIPIWLQLVCSVIVVSVSWFLPETPRWLMSRDRHEQARRIIVKYHGDDDPNSPIVTLQMNELTAEISTSGADKRFYSYKTLFNTRNARWRIWQVCMMAVIGQLSGNGVTGPFLPTLAGVTNTHQVLEYNVGLSCVCMAVSPVGCRMVDMWGRRTLLFTVCCLMTASLVFMSAAAGVYHNDSSKSAAGTASIAFIYIFQSCYAFGITPLQSVYPTECLRYETRAKGMAFSSFAGQVAGVLTQFAMPVAIGKIGYTMFIINAAWDAFECAIVYFFFAETKGRTLEELDEVFDAKYPRKASTQKKRIVLDSTDTIMDIKEA